MSKNVQIVARAEFVDQTALFPSSPLFVASADGNFRLSVYTDVTNNPSAIGSIFADIKWTDNQNAEEIFTDTLGYNASGPFAKWQTLVLRLVKGSVLTIAGAGNAAPSGSTYSMFFTLEEI